MQWLQNIKELIIYKSGEDQVATIPIKGLGDMGENIVKETRGDKMIWAIVIVLTLASLLLIYSSTGSLAYRNKNSTEVYLFKQLGMILTGFIIIYFSHRVNYTFYKRVAVLAFLLSLPLLIYTLFFGVQLNEGSRWIKLPVINQTFQTSDFAKLALFIFMSRLLSKRQGVIKSFWKGYFPLIASLGLICILVAPANLSTAILIGGTGFLLMFIGRVNGKHLLLTFSVIALPVFILIGISINSYDTTNKQAKKLPDFLNVGRIPTWVSRIQVFAYGGKDKDNEKMYQINQAKIAIANGGWIGKGPGNSVQRNFLPHCYSDFIYAIIVEEYGLAGAFFVLSMYLIFLFRCIRIYRKCPYAFGAFLALALSFMLVIQAMINMGVNVSLLPNTGVTLPLVSMGGSSFLFTCLSIGIILSVARNVEKMEGGEPMLTDPMTDENSGEGIIANA